MSILPLLVFGGFLLVLMVWLRWSAPTHPNAALLLETMRRNLEGRDDWEGRAP